MRPPKKKDATVSGQGKLGGLPKDTLQKPTVLFPYEVHGDYSFQIESGPPPSLYIRPLPSPFYFHAARDYQAGRMAAARSQVRKRYRPHTQPQCSRLMKNISQNANKTLLKCYTLRESPGNYTKKHHCDADQWYNNLRFWPEKDPLFLVVLLFCGISSYKR